MTEYSAMWGSRAVTKTGRTIKEGMQDGIYLCFESAEVGVKVDDPPIQPTTSPSNDDNILNHSTEINYIFTSCMHRVGSFDRRI